MGEKEAQIIGIKGLEFLASDPEKFSVFINVTGMSAQDVTNSASEPSTLIGILDYLLSDETLLLEFCSYSRLPAEQPRTARMILSREDFY